MTADRAARWLVALAGGLVASTMITTALSSADDRVTGGWIWLALGVLLALWIGRGADLGAVAGRGALLFGATFGGIPAIAALVTGSDPLARVAVATLGFSTLPFALGYVAERPQDLAHSRLAWIPRVLLAVYPALAIGLAATALGDPFFWLGFLAGLALSVFALRATIARGDAIARAFVLAGSATAVANAVGYFDGSRNEAATAMSSLGTTFGAGLLLIGLVILVGQARARERASAPATS